MNSWQAWPLQQSGTSIFMPGYEFLAPQALTSRDVIAKFARLAQVAKLVDALVSGISVARRGGSSPLLGTIKQF